MVADHTYNGVSQINGNLEKLGEVPRCFNFMQGRLLDYEEGKSLTVVFPVLESYTNPAGSMQGGLITAAFDNVFGPMCLLVGKKSPTTTIDINTSYHRPIFPGDEITITVRVKTQGKTKIYMLGEAFNKDNKLIATATSTYIYLKAEKK